MRFSKSSHTVALVFLLWIGIAGAFLYWRSQEGLVWCDTVIVAQNLFEEAEPLRWGQPGTLHSIIQNSFSVIGAEGYRPLSRIILWAGIALFSTQDFNPFLWNAAGGLVIGSMAVVFFLVARRFLQSDYSSLLALFLFLFATPVVTGAWNMSCGFQAIVPLMICLGLLFYWKTVESGKKSSWYATGLILVFALGPWFREFIGLLPLLIIFLEAQRARRPTTLTLIAAAGFVHALYPTAVMKWIFYPDLEIRSIFAMGHLGVQSSTAVQHTGSVITQLLSDISAREMPLHFLTLYPPVIFVLCLAAALLPLIRETNNRSSTGAGFFGSRTEFKLSLVFLFGIIIISTIAWRTEFDSTIIMALFSWLCFGLVLLGLRTDLFLTWWFLLFFLPFLKVFTEQVHLAYTLLPASIIVVSALQDLWLFIGGSGLVLSVCRYVFSIALAVATADHLLNPIASYHVVHSINQGISQTALWFRSNVPPDSVIISNALHAEDIRLFSDGHFKVYWTVQSGIPRNSDAVSEPKQLENLLRVESGRRDVYFLDVNFDYTPDKVHYHSHKYVHGSVVDRKDLGVIHRTSARYPFIDPIKAWVSRPYVSFLGPPDLENDFYRGPARNGAYFMREVYAEYHVYKVIGTAVDPWNSIGPVKLVREGYRGFNVVVLNGRFFAIPQSEGEFQIERIRKKLYSTSFVSDDYEQILFLIDEAVDAVPDRSHAVSCQPISSSHNELPILLAEGYRGFNLIEYAGRFYAIPQGEGAFSIDRISRSEYSRWFFGCLLNEVKRQIDQSVQK